MLAGGRAQDLKHAHRFLRGVLGLVQMIRQHRRAAQQPHEAVPGAQLRRRDVPDGSGVGHVRIVGVEDAVEEGGAGHGRDTIPDTARMRGVPQRAGIRTDTRGVGQAHGRAVES